MKILKPMKILRFGKIAEAEAVSPIVNNLKIEDLDGENSTTLKENLTILEDENEIAKSEPVGKSGSERLLAEDLKSSASAAEVSVVKNSSIEPPITENSTVENSTDDQSSSGKDEVDFVQTRTRWIGKLCEELGLTGEVTEKNFASLARGIHPHTGEQFIRHVKPRRSRFLQSPRMIHGLSSRTGVRQSRRLR